MAESADDAPKAHGLSGLVIRLRDSARAFVRAEVEYVIAELGVRASAVLPALAMIIIAMAIGFSLLTAVLIGLIIGLAPYLTIWGSIGVVASVALLTIFVLVKRASAIVRLTQRSGDEADETNA
jgi:hypothetical protein